MSWSLYISLSVMMFLEYAVWGAWMPVMAPRLLGPLKMTGKQCGWIFATLPIACIVSPLIAGQLADRWLNTEWILAAAHLAGGRAAVPGGETDQVRADVRGDAAVLVLLRGHDAAGQLADVRPTGQGGTCNDVSGASAKIFIMAPIAWALIGYLLTGWRQVTKTEGGAADGFVFGGLLSVAMGVSCLFLPATPPAGTGEGRADAASPGPAGWV